jgi:hypothetical protein
MIILKLKGGLGNQMFQYAYGRSLATKKAELLKLDLSEYTHVHQTTDTPRAYSLSNFVLHPDITIADQKEITRAQYPKGILSRLTNTISKKIFRKYNVGWNSKIFTKNIRTKKDLYLDGFWQSEKYFIDCANIIRKEFTLTKSFATEARQIADKITAAHPRSVSVHVRRGDVAQNAETNPYYGITTPEYYAHALEKARELIGSEIQVFVFSDDIEWAQKNIPITYPVTYVSRPVISDVEELTLMSQCRCNIIANSSFSWWAGWLNKHPNKIVIAPTEWITRNKSWHADTVPTSWIRVQ